MTLGSYKPRAGQLQPTPALREFFLEHFKGVKAKQIRMSGELFSTVSEFITNIHSGQKFEEEFHRKLLLNMVTSFRRTMYGKDRLIKKRRYETGYSTKNFQVLMTHSTYPVPHLPWIGISLVTLDVGIPGSKEQVIRFVSWDLCFDGDVDENLIDFYLKTVKRPTSIDNPYSDGLVDMIFEMVKPPASFTDMNLLAASIKAA